MHLVREEYQQLTDRVAGIQQELISIVSLQPQCQLLSSVPGIGVINATAIYSAIGNGNQFKHAREFAVWLGLTPVQTSSGNTFKSGGITKRGNRYLRKQLVHGARALPIDVAVELTSSVSGPTHLLPDVDTTKR